MRKALLAFLLGVVILVLLSGCIGGRASQVLPSRRIEISRELADSAWGKIYTAQRQGSFSLSFTESELTSLLVFTLEERLKEQPLREPRIWIEKEKIIFAATLVDLAPSPLNLVVEFQLYVEGGAVGVRFLKIKVNRTSLPAVTLRTLSRIASETLAEAKLQVYVEEIRTETGVIFIKGRITS